MTLLYEKESYVIRGAAFDVYKELRSGHKEKVYQEAFYLSLKKKGLGVDREHRIKIYYTGEKVGTYTPEDDIKQFWQYLRGSRYKLGFLINFGAADGVEILRRVYDTARIQHFLPRSSALRSAGFRD